MRKKDHSRAGSGHIQKACDEWLTTRNKSKIQPPVVPHKKHPNALRHRQNFTASALMLTQSAPPTQLKTCTKQTNILSFFQSSGRTNTTDDKGTHEHVLHSGIIRDELDVSDCEDVSSLAYTSDQGLQSPSPGFTDSAVHREHGREDDIYIPDPKKRRLHMERVSSEMHSQEMMEFINSNSSSKGNKYYTCHNNESQSADIDSDGPNNESQSADIDSDGPNNESQSADIDSDGPNNESQSAEIGSDRPNNESQSADIDSDRPNNESQSADIDSDRSNNESQSADIDSDRSNNESQSADIDSDNFDQPVSSESHYGQPKRKRLQKNVNMDRAVSHSIETLNNFSDDTPDYFVHNVEDSYSSSGNIVDNADLNTVNNKKLKLIGSIASNIHNAQANNLLMMEGKCSGSNKQDSLQSDSLCLDWTQSDKVQKRNLVKELENSSDSCSDILSRYTSQSDGQDSPGIYAGDEFQFKSRDSLDKADSIYLDSEFTLRFQREKYDRRERQSRLIALQSNASLSSVKFSFENDSQY